MPRWLPTVRCRPRTGRAGNVSRDRTGPGQRGGEAREDSASMVNGRGESSPGLGILNLGAAVSRCGVREARGLRFCTVRSVSRSRRGRVGREPDGVGGSESRSVPSGAVNGRASRVEKPTCRACVG